MKQTVVSLFQPWKKRELYDLCNTVREDDEESLHNLRHWLLQHRKHRKRFMEAAGYLDEWNNTPLHWIAMHQPPADVVEVLIRNAPGTLQMKNSIGWLPLQFACLHGASLEVLDLLVKDCPESVDMKGMNFGDKPSQLMQEWAHHHGGQDHLYFLHNAVLMGFSTPLVKLLLEAFPESCRKRDVHGNIPLHYACCTSSMHSLEIVVMLLQACPESYSVLDNYGKTPSCYFAKVSSEKNHLGMMMLHRYAAYSKALDVHAFSFVFDAHPESVLTPDIHGMLPFHHACLNEASSVDTLMSVLTLFPESIASSLLSSPS